MTEAQAARDALRLRLARDFAVALLSTDSGQQALKRVPASEGPPALIDAAVCLADLLLARVAPAPEPEAGQG